MRNDSMRCRPNAAAAPGISVPAKPAGDTEPLSGGASFTSPPRAALVFRVGVIGHRPDRLVLADPALLRNVVRECLSHVQQAVKRFAADRPDLYAPGEARLRVVSPLAEGSDRIVADEAMKLGYELHCPMPFCQAEYEKDFLPPHALAPDSLSEFRELLERGKRGMDFAGFEMDGDRLQKEACYGATGRVVLHHSDILIGIWDGGPPRGGGGTVDKLREAATFGIPVIWVDAKAPHRWAVIRTPERLPAPSASPMPSPPEEEVRPWRILRTVVKHLRPPGPRRRPPPGGFEQRFKNFLRMMDPNRTSPRTDLRQEFFGERKPYCNLAFVWRLFRDYVAQGQAIFQRPEVEDFETAVAPDWPTGGETPPKPAGEDLPSPEATARQAACATPERAGNSGALYRGTFAAAWANRALRAHYAWADKLADFYADHYRSSYVLAFFLGVAAVTLALAPFVLPSILAHAGIAPHVVSLKCAEAELVVIVAVLVLIAVNWGWRWHERWMDYRLVAELVRQLRCLLPLGGGRPFPRVARHLESYGDPTQTWMYWHVRNIEREVGMPNATLNRPFLQEALDFILVVQQEQLRFHDTSHHRSEQIEGRLHLVGYLLFVATFGVCVAHILGEAEHAPHALRALAKLVPTEWLLVLAAVLPTLGAALAGISNQGEFGRVAKRSKAMMKRLAVIGEKATRLKTSNALRSEQVVAVASELAQLMVDEVLDWRVVFTDRPPVLPA